ncbi:hypothetical protein NEHOM01_1127 [Nematocida homosporus]|uniref:uncharacterized protein n=1 Tax=Nematocida homosporus TaxID=1912981 RepID=UPI0022211A12|nr:uncharacterized protein NEHOM01_1127 [Nematocida homosporus]KAI5185877.1 hypothetical protein NEHOM01_1127 [Nematocida homosporus]
MINKQCCGISIYKTLKICKSFVMQSIKRYVLKRLNCVLSERIEPIEESDVICDFLRGVIIVERMRVKSQIIEEKLGLKVRESDGLLVKGVVLNIPWYISGAASEVRIESLEISLDGSCCLCARSKVCFACGTGLSRPEELESGGFSMGIVSWVSRKIVEILTEYLIFEVGECKLSLQLADKHWLVMNGLKVSRDGERISLELADGQLDMFGVKMERIAGGLVMADKKVVATGDLQRILVDIDRVAGQDVLKLINLIKNQNKNQTKISDGIVQDEDIYLTQSSQDRRDDQKEQQQDSEQVPKLFTDLDIRCEPVVVQVRGLVGWEEYALEVETSRVYRDSDEFKIVTNLALVEQKECADKDCDGSTKYITKARLDECQVDLGSFNGPHKNINLAIDLIKCQLKSADLIRVQQSFSTIQAKLAPLWSTEHLSDPINEDTDLSVDTNDKKLVDTSDKKSVEERIDIVAAVNQLDVALEMPNTTAHLNLSLTVMHIDKKINFATDGQLTVLQNESQERASLKGSISLGYLDTIKVNDLSLALLESIQPTVTVLHSAVIDTKDLISHLFPKQIEQSKQSKQSKSKQSINSPSTSISAQLDKIKLSVLMNGHNLQVLLERVQITSLGFLIPTLSATYLAKPLLTLGPLTYQSQASPNLSLANADIYPPDDDTIIAILYEIEAALQSISTSSDTNTSPSDTNTSPSQPFTLDVLNSNVHLYHPFCQALLHIEQLVLENTTHSLAIQTLKATAINHQEALLISSQNFVFNSQDRTLQGHFSASGSLTSDLYVFSLNRALFLLIGYCILTEHEDENTPELSTKDPMKIALTASGQILLKERNTPLLSLSAQAEFTMTKTTNYFGQVVLKEIEAQDNDQLICSIPNLQVEFARTNPLTMILSVDIPVITATTFIAPILDLQAAFLGKDHRYGMPWVSSYLEVRAKASTISLANAEGTELLLTDLATVNNYHRLNLQLNIDKELITPQPATITIRSSAYDKSELTISLSPLELSLQTELQCENLQLFLTQLHKEKKSQKYPQPPNGLLKIECTSVQLSIPKPQLKLELQQIALVVDENIEFFALARAYGLNQETLTYEVLVEQFPIDLNFQPNMPVYKDKTGFVSLPFSDADDDSLLVSFAAIAVKEVLRLRLSAKMIDALKLSNRTIKLTNLTNKTLYINDLELVSFSSTTIKDHTPIYTKSGQLLFSKYPPNTTQAITKQGKTFLATIKDDSAVIRGASNFKNITDSTILIRTQKDQMLLMAFSECSYIHATTKFSIEIDKSIEEKTFQIEFDLTHTQETSHPEIQVVGKQKIAHIQSYLSVICLLENVSGQMVLHYLFFHEFIITNLTNTPVTFEIKINTNSQIERITGVANPGDNKQMSGMYPADSRKARLRLNNNTDINFHKDESQNRTSLTKGIYALKERKIIPIQGHLIDIGIFQAIIYPQLIAINKTADDLAIASGSRIVRLQPDTQTEIYTSKDRHTLIYHKKESSAFSSKIHSNTIFLSIRADYNYNYLVNIHKGEGGKEMIRYIVVEYANVIENTTGIDLTIITDREFFCGHQTLVPIHFAKKKTNAWIRLGTPQSPPSSFKEDTSSCNSDYIIELEDSTTASYLPLDGLKKHLVKLTKDNIPILLSINVHVRNTQRVISISKETKWPYLIRNLTDFPMTFCQKGHHKTYLLQAGDELPYYWDSFKALPAFDILVDNTSLLVENFTAVLAGNYKALLISEGGTRILQVTQLTQDSLSEAPPTNQGTLIQLQLTRISASLLDRHESEFSCFHLFDISLNLMISQNGVEFLAKVGTLQMDNQENRAIYPVPIHMPSQSDSVLLSGWLVNPSTCRYLSLMILPIAIEVDETYMKKVMAHFVPVAEEIENPKYFIRCSLCESLKCKCTYAPQIPKQSQYISLGYVRVEPIRIKFSFRRAPQKSIVPLSSVFCNLNNSKISLPAIQLNDVHAKYSEVLQIVGKTYKRGIIKNIVSLALSVDIVGSPGELIDKLGVGVHDLISAPYRALDNPALLSKRLLSGGKSLAKNVVSGVADLVGNITGGISQKLASISMDENFIEMSNETSCIYIDDVEMGLPVSKTHLSKAREKFMGSVISGFRGVLHSPIEGSKSSGLSGMVQGLGKGIVGAVLKPISGAMGLAQGVTTTISGALQESKPLLRIQLPRAPLLGQQPTEYETCRNIYYRAYTCLITGDLKKAETYITGGTCLNNYQGWEAIITTKRVIFYNKSEFFEMPGEPTVQAADKNTLLTINRVSVELEGSRILKDFSRMQQ